MPGWAFVLPDAPEDELAVDVAALVGPEEDAGPEEGAEPEDDDESPEDEEPPEEGESLESPVLDFPSVEPDEELPDSDCIAFFRDSEG